MINYIIKTREQLTEISLFRSAIVKIQDNLYMEKKENTHKTGFLKTVEKTLEALELLNERQSLGITELSHLMKIGTSTAHRILSTLEKNGFAEKIPESNKYTVGHKVYALSKSLSGKISSVKCAQRYVDELCSETNENTVYCTLVPQKDKTIILVEKIPNRAITARSFIYQHFPLHICPCGKLYLSSLTDDEMDRNVSKYELKKYTKFTPDTTLLLTKQLQQARKYNFCSSHNEFEIGLSVSGAGVYNCNNQFIGALMLLGPSDRFTKTTMSTWQTILTDAAMRMTQEMKNCGIEF